MLTREAITFSKLGQLARECAKTEYCQDAVSFQEGAVTDSVALNLIKQGLNLRLSRPVTNLVNCVVDTRGTFSGEFQQRINTRLTKRFSFKFGENIFQFEPLNAEDIEKFSESETQVDFAKYSKAGRAGRSLACKIEQCGGRCLRSGEACRLTATEAQKGIWTKANARLGTKPDTSLAKKRRETKADREANKTTSPVKQKKAVKPQEKIVDKKKQELENLKNEKYDSLQKLWERTERLSGEKKEAFGEAVEKHFVLKAKPKDKKWSDGMEGQANSLWKIAGTNPAVPKTARERLARFVGDESTREIIKAPKGKISDQAISRVFGQENPVGRASFQASQDPQKMGSSGKIVEEWAKGLGQTGWIKATPRQKAMILSELAPDGIKELGIEFTPRK